MTGESLQKCFFLALNWKFTTNWPLEEECDLLRLVQEVIANEEGRANGSGNEWVRLCVCV